MTTQEKTRGRSDEHCVRFEDDDCFRSGPSEEEWRQKPLEEDWG